MKIKTIKAKNFLSYHEFSLDVNCGLCLISGFNEDDNTANGAGKTALIDAICFGLFGQIPRNIKIDDIIHKQFIDEPCLVIVQLEDNGKVYRVERSRNPNIIKLYIDNIEVIGKDAKETQQLIERALGISYSIFVNSVYFYQNAHSHFVSANDNDKKDILTELLDLEVFDKAYNYTHVELKDLESKAFELDTKIQNYECQISNNLKDIEKYTVASNQFEDNKKHRISSVNKQIEELQCQVSTYTKSIGTKQNSLANTKDLKGTIEKIISKQSTVKRAQSAVDDLSKAKDEISYRRKMLDEKLNKFLSQKEDTCSLCFQKIGEDHVHKQKVEIQGQIEDCKIKDERFVGLLKPLLETLEVGQQLEQKKSSIATTIASYEGVLNEIKLIEQNIANLQISEKEYRNSVVEINKETNEYDVLASDKKETNDKFEQEKLSCQKNYQLIFNKIGKFKFMKDVYRNVKYYVFDSVVAELNDKINEYVSTLFDSDVQIKFDTETKLYKGDIRQKFITRILKDGVERVFNSLSGGEQRRVELATNFALSDIIANRSNKTFNIMMLDENFNDLDAEGRERIVHLLKLLKQKRENIFIVDHFESVRNLVDSEIHVVKRNGISQIERIV